MRSQLEPYIAAELGAENLASRKHKTELTAIDKEIADIRTRLTVLEARRGELTRG